MASRTRREETEKKQLKERVIFKRIEKRMFVSRYFRNGKGRKDWKGDDDRCWMIYIYIYIYAASVCYRKLEEKTARGPTLCTFTGVSHSVVGVSHLAAGFPLSRLSHLIRTRRLRRLLKWRSPSSSHLLSSPYLRGKGPGAVLSFPKAETQPSNQSRESLDLSSNSNSAANYRLSPP